MRATEVGGDTNTIASGGSALARTSANVRAASSPLSSALRSASAAVGHDALAAAVDRARAAWATEVADLATGLHAAATLATNAADDLDQAGS